MLNRRTAFLAVVTIGLLACAAIPAVAQKGGAIVQMPDHFDISPPIRDLNAPPPTDKQNHEHPLHMPGPPRKPSSAPDPVVQSATGALVGATTGVNFDGVGANGYAPPDTNMAVGKGDYIVQWVNVQFAVYHKNGTIYPGFPKFGNSIWSGFGGDCQNKNGGDPIAQYDAANDRWLMTQLGSTSNPYSECIAVSTTNDPTGSYARYSYSYGGTLNDYPKFGVWPDAYYASYNLFYGGSGGQACAYDSAAMRSGSASAASICFTSEYSLLPSDVDGPTAPPAGSPNYYITLGSSTALHLYKFHVDFVTPSDSTFTGPTSITVGSYTEPGFSSCIPQMGTTQLLDCLGDRPMYRLAYRNFGTHEAMVFNHSVTANGVVGARWYEIRDPNGTPTAYQQGTFAPSDGVYRWMGSVAMDQAGDIALGYSVSSGSLHPGIRYTGRIPTDPLGTMEAEASILEGCCSQAAGLSRWGDYSAMRIDPGDDCTFWYTNEYLPTDGTFNWSTRIASFKFAGCGGPPPPPPDMAPVLNSANAKSATEVDLAWTNLASNATGNRVLRCTGSMCTPSTTIASLAATVHTYNDTSAAANTTYGYAIEAFNSGGTKDSNFLYATTPKPPPPAAPTAVHATNVLSNEIDLAWTNNANSAAGIRVLSCSGSLGCPPTVVIATLSATATSYNNTGLTASRIYRYVIEAYDNYAQVGDSSPALTVTTLAPSLPPAVPVLTVGSPTKTSLTLTWTEASSPAVTSFDVLRCTGSGCTPTTVVVAGLSGSARSYRNTGLSRRTTYTYEVRANNGGGSTLSNPASGRTN